MYRKIRSNYGWRCKDTTTGKFVRNEECEEKQKEEGIKMPVAENKIEKIKEDLQYLLDFFEYYRVNIFADKNDKIKVEIMFRKHNIPWKWEKAYEVLKKFWEWEMWEGSCDIAYFRFNQFVEKESFVPFMRKIMEAIAAITDVIETRQEYLKNMNEIYKLYLEK